MIDKGFIVTFYSYKGGVGRSMAVANIGILLARLGFKTLIVDWDLEAPGIENYYKDYSDLKSIDQKEGLIDFLLRIADDENLDASGWIELTQEINLRGNKAPLHLIKAGKRDITYFQKVRNFDVRQFYEVSKGGYQIEYLRKQWSENYDFVLIDSRTGVTDSGGICTVQLPDILFLLFSATEQSLAGIINIANNVFLARQELPFDRLKLLMVPIASRFDVDKEFELSAQWLSESASRLSTLFADWLPTTVSAIDILQITKIPYKAYFSFGEKLAVIEESAIEKSSLSYAYKIIAALVSQKLENIEGLLTSQDSYIAQASNKGSHIFISHSSKDEIFVRDLRINLETHGLSVWIDSRSTSEESRLSPAVERAIEQARQVIVVLSPNSIESAWTRSEISKALQVEKERKDYDYRVIPVLLPGIQPSGLPLWFDEEPVGIRIELKTFGVNEALPQILAALGERLPDDKQPIQDPVARPVVELKLKLRGASIEEVGEGKWRVKATAQLIYDPADSARPTTESQEFIFTAPLGPIEADDLRWYLERYYLWPTGVFTERATHIAEQLPQWGRALYDAATAAQSARELLADWQQTAEGIERRFSIFVDSRLLEGSSNDEQAAANEAASALLALPWELMHDGRAFLFQGKNPVRVRRCLPKERAEKAIASSLPIRILLLSPRPEDERAGYIDHRLSARPLLNAVESLGELAELTMLNPPTFPALQQALRKAADADQPFDVIHFDGMGVYNRERGLGALCFEDPQDSDKTVNRKIHLIDAEKLAEVVREHRIPLVFIEACQSASEERPTASVAAKLLGNGVTSVVAMTHSVLVETARRFVTTFYRELAEGKRIGTAMLAGQHALYDDDLRGRVMGAGELRLQDWFVPVLYQEENDPQLVTRLLPEQVQILHANRRRLNLGALPEPPAHSFIGRSRELLALERLLQIETSPEQSYAVVRGQGGEGKTTLAAELARWLVRTNRFRRAAFVSLEHYTDARGVLDSLGRQLLPEGENYSVAQYRDLDEASQPVARALRDHPTIIVIDNVESVLVGYGTGSVSDLPPLPNAEAQVADAPRTASEVDEIFMLCRTLLRVHPATRIIFTSREPLPAPFDHRQREIVLGALSRDDAIELVSQVMEREGRKPKYDDAGNTPQEITELVEAVNRHARALVLLTPEISRSGVRATTENLHRLMAALDAKHPDDREQSLYASVELSLRRLPTELCEQARVLGVFHGGAHLGVLRYVLGLDANDVKAVQKLAVALIEVGLAEAMPYGHLRLDPALPSYLLGQMSAAEHEQARSRWAEGMRGLTTLLVQQRFQDAQLAAQLTLLELPNLLALLAWAQGALTPEEVVSLAGSLESLLSKLGRPQALAQATWAREQAAQRLGAWSHAQFESLRQGIERLLEQGRLPEAQAAAEQLLQRALAASEATYAGAAYDIAMAHWQFGRVLKTIGAAEDALPPLHEAQQRFQALADADDTYAELMASAAITDAAACLLDLGRYDEGAAAYEEGIQRAEKLGDRRQAAVGRGQLGTVRLQQKRYGEALESYREALRIFESLGEPLTVAGFQYRIGIAHREAGQFEQAEQSYRQSLAIEVQQQNRAGEAASLTELGNLYGQMGRLEEAATFFRQAVDIYTRLQDKRYEGGTRSNLAYTLIKLQRYDEARSELHRAIECKQPFGHAAQLWTTWDILHNLEQATGDAQAAEAARGQAIVSYLAYRRAGGECQSNAAQLFAIVRQAIEQDATTEVEQTLDELSRRDIPALLQTLVAKLRAILRGDRDPALAADPNLEFMDAVELQLLLEKL